ncbi:MAG: sulfite exporter TauE/SafE family protein, partial [Lysobacterales bacterium]
LGGLSMHRAVATSLVIIALKSFTGFWKYLDVLESHGLALDWHVIAIVTVLGIAGSFIGARIAGHVDQHKLRKVFGLFLIVMGIYILVRTLPSVLT